MFGRAGEECNGVICLGGGGGGATGILAFAPPPSAPLPPWIKPCIIILMLIPAYQILVLESGIYRR